jgi:hypothetical protein
VELHRPAAGEALALLHRHCSGDRRPALLPPRASVSALVRGWDRDAGRRRLLLPSCNSPTSGTVVFSDRSLRDRVFTYWSRSLLGERVGCAVVLCGAGPVWLEAHGLRHCQPRSHEVSLHAQVPNEKTSTRLHINIR